jgi:hypothetical protein
VEVPKKNLEAVVQRSSNRNHVPQKELRGETMSLPLLLSPSFSAQSLSDGTAIFRVELPLPHPYFPRPISL